MFSQKSRLHARIGSFVDWIRTEKSRESNIRAQTEEIRKRVRGRAEKDGLVIRSTPWSGSFAKKTGLRRHMVGKHPVEGQDVDLPFVVSPKTAEDETLTSLLDRFDTYLGHSYPDTTRERTKSSVKMSFVGTKLNYDVVPLLATDDDQRQILIRSDGERRETSVQAHISFIKSRTGMSGQQKGRVKFNEMVRLFKWWREVQFEGECDTYTSMLLGLLCSHAFDELGVERTYQETLVKWFAKLAHDVEHRKAIYFSDFVIWDDPPTSSVWSVIDPVSQTNNIAGHLSRAEVDVLAHLLAQGRDDMLQAIAVPDDEEDRAVSQLERLFGRPIVHNS